MKVYKFFSFISETLGKLTAEQVKLKLSFCKLLVLLSGTIISVFLTLSDNPSHLIPLLKYAILLQMASLLGGLSYYYAATFSPHSILRQLQREERRLPVGPITDEIQTGFLTLSGWQYMLERTSYAIQLFFFLASYVCIFAYVLFL